jgi:hypothetical protein
VCNPFRAITSARLSVLALNLAADAMNLSGSRGTSAINE